MILTRKDYYSTDYILFNILNQLKFSYLSVRKTDSKGKNHLVRYYMGYSLKLLKQSMEKTNAFDETSRMYYDLPIWRDERGYTPLFSFNNKERIKQKKDFNRDNKKYFKGYSFAIDIDGEKIQDAWKDTKKIKDYFDEKKLPYSIKFSGSRGFHIIIDDKWFPNISPKKKVVNAQRMANVIMNISGLKSHSEGGTFDDSIYDDRRIFKLAYSLVNNKGKEYVCLPLTDEQFNNFRIEDMEMLNVVKNVRIFKRGLLERDHSLNQEQLQENINKLLKEVNYG